MRIPVTYNVIIMDPDKLSTFRKQLLALEAELVSIGESSKDSRATVVLDQQSVGRLSRMDAIQAQQMAQETERRRTIQCQRIDAALKRIDAGEFGECFICGEPIDPRRLSFDPTTTRCVDCVDG